MKSIFWPALVFLVVNLTFLQSAEPAVLAALPADWQKEWNSPPVECRPLQIVHGYLEGIANPQSMEVLKQIGLGGIVCNVSFDQYMTSEPHWQTLIQSVEACRQAGLRVWIYDEDGYPSATAGGLVLKTNPAFEAQALAYDPSQSDLFIVRPSYEFTHASNNVCAARRYANLIEAAAMQCFIKKTHQAYWQRLEPYFGNTIEAFFTDEPSLMTVHSGLLPEEIRKNVRVVDPIDPNIKAMPSVAWAADLPEQYKKRYNQDLLAVRKSLFEGNTPEDRMVRRQFWQLIADLTADRYFGQIQDWCKPHHVASSGHPLREESLVHHVPEYGNLLACLMRMDIPGLDLLTSDPERVMRDKWLTGALPLSAALFNGGRKVMTEVSHFEGTLSGGTPATLPQRQATAAWQAAFGVTEFTLYYHYRAAMQDPPADAPNEFTWQQNKAYYDYVGRLNAILRPAKPVPAALLYYPIYDLWAQYLPTGERLSDETQSDAVQKLLRCFRELGRHLTKNQIPLALADHNLLAKAEIRDRKIWINNVPFSSVFIPAGAELPPEAALVVQKFQQAGGLVCQNKELPEIDFAPFAKASNLPRLQPAAENIILGRFLRDQRTIYLLVNVSGQPYEGTISPTGSWLHADPADGQIDYLKPAVADDIPIHLPAYSAKLITTL